MNLLLCDVNILLKRIKENHYGLVSSNYWISSRLLFGYDEGIIAGSLDLIKTQFNMSHTSVGVMTSALPFGALFGSMLVGSILASKVVKHIGRKKCLSLRELCFYRCFRGYFCGS